MHVFMSQGYLLPLLPSIGLYFRDKLSKQPLDYDRIPFYCWHQHEYGHLFKECSLHIVAMKQPKDPPMNPKGFTPVNSNHKNTKDLTVFETDLGLYTQRRLKALIGTSSNTSSMKQEPSQIDPIAANIRTHQENSTIPISFSIHSSPL